MARSRDDAYEEDDRPRRSRDDDYDDRPRRSRDDDYDDRSRGRYDDDYDARPRSGGKSGSVTGLAVISIILGSLVLLFGLCMLIVVVAAGSEAGRQGGFKLPGVGGAIAIVVIMTLLILLWGAGTISAGIGLINRSNWSRILTLILGAFGGLAGLYFLFSGFVLLAAPDPGIPGAAGSKALGFFIALLIAAVFLTHAIYGYIVCLNSSVAAEFK